MPLNYTVHPIAKPVYGQRPVALALDGPIVGQFGLATATASASITGPCEVRLFPDEAERIDIRNAADFQSAANNTPGLQLAAATAALAPAASPLKIPANVETRILLPNGVHVMSWA